MSNEKPSAQPSGEARRKAQKKAGNADDIYESAGADVLDDEELENVSGGSKALGVDQKQNRSGLSSAINSQNDINPVFTD